MATVYEQREKLSALKRELEQGEAMSDEVVIHNHDAEVLKNLAAATRELRDSYTAQGAVAVHAAKIDNQGRSWIEVMPTAEKARNGSWYFTITAEDLSTLADYIKANPDRISIDYDHFGAERGDTRAAGWFTGDAAIVKAGEENYDGEVQDRPSVWAQVKWTPAAVEEIRDGVYRFISPEWQMANKDKKSGLMTKLKELAAATLTNRPFFKDLAAVKARHLMESEQIDALSERYGSEISALVLAANESEDEKVSEALKAVLAVKPEETKEEPKPPPTKEPIVADETKAPDYLKMLGLDETADPNKKWTTALKAKDEETLALTAKVTELTAKLKENDELNERVKDLEARDRKRENEVYLARAVDKGQVLPAEKETLANLFSDNVQGLRELIATRPAGFSSLPLKPTGIVGDPDRFGDDAEVAAYVKANTFEEPIDTESAKLHLQAEKILKDKGKDDYTPDEYIKACEEASKQLVS